MVDAMRVHAHSVTIYARAEVRGDVSGARSRELLPLGGYDPTRFAKKTIFDVVYFEFCVSHAHSREQWVIR